MANEKTTELETLRERCFIFCDFCYEKYGHLELYKKTKEGIEKEYQKQNLKGLRLASKDMNNWLKEMPYQDVVELGKILKKQLNEDIGVIEKKRMKIIKQVLDRGKIASIEEYQILRDRVDEIYADSSKLEELSILNRLLAEYQTGPTWARVFFTPAEKEE